MVLRMMEVLKRASKRTWQDIEEALYLFLTMPKDTTDLIKHVQAWDPGKLRKDIMAFSEHEFVASEIDMEDEDQSFQLIVYTGGLRLPETQDAQWFPETEAAARSGVGPHPKMDETLQRISLPLQNGSRVTTTAQEIRLEVWKTRC